MAEPLSPNDMVIHISRTLWGPSGFLIEAITPGHIFDDAWHKLQHEPVWRVVLPKLMPTRVVETEAASPSTYEGITLLAQAVAAYGSQRKACAIQFADDEGLTLYRRWQQEVRNYG